MTNQLADEQAQWERLLAEMRAEIEQLRGNLTLAEDGLARAKLHASEAEKEMLSQTEKRRLAHIEIEQLKRDLRNAQASVAGLASATQEIQLLRDQRDTNLAKEVETVRRLDAEIERLRARLALETAALEQACARWGTPDEPDAGDRGVPTDGQLMDQLEAAFEKMNDGYVCMDMILREQLARTLVKFNRGAEKSGEQHEG